MHDGKLAATFGARRGGVVKVGSAFLVSIRTQTRHFVPTQIEVLPVVVFEG